MSGKIYQGSRLVAQTNDAPLGFEDKGIELESLAQYEQLKKDGNLQEDVNYYIKDGQNTIDSSSVTYNNTASGISATNVQDAIDEVNSTAELASLLDNAISYATGVSRGLRLCYVYTKTSVNYRGKVLNCYTSIQEAIDTEYAARTWELGVAVIILPGTYTENVRFDDKRNIMLIGVDRYMCKLIGYEDDAKSGYYYPPLWICPSTTVMNLYISNPTTRNKTDAYCIHSDVDGSGAVLIKNCIIINEQHACIGFGTRQYAPLFIEDCVLTSNSASGNCLYGHNDHAGNSTVKNEELHISRCVMRTAGSAPALDIFDANHFFPNGGNGSLDWLIYMNDNIITNGNELPASALTTGSYKAATLDDCNYFSKFVRKMPSNAGNNCKFANYVLLSNTTMVTGNGTPVVSDLNDAVGSLIGETFFRCDVSAANRPTSQTTHWIVKSIKYDDDLYVQVAYATHFTVAYMRNKISGSWTSWVALTAAS